jgi:HEPN domain-containing protein
MNDRQNVLSLLAMAKKDLSALAGMHDSHIFSDEIFGFHAQQVIEKCCKAWIALSNQKYPFTHDLSLLLKQLEESGFQVADLWDYTEMTAFAMNIRYEGIDETAEPLDRTAILKDTQALYESVMNRI